jgi:aquaporin NIP
MKNIPKKYIAEAVGTFGLSFVVLGALSYVHVLPVAVPVIAALTLGLFVYTIGSVSGCHINPAVSVGVWFVKKISSGELLRYIAAQLIGAVAAVLVAKWFMIVSPITGGVFDVRVFVAEALGTFFFVFGIASVVYGKVRDALSGVVIGGSLLLGILVSSVAGAAGILNPAVALALSAHSIVYLGAPFIGAIGAFLLYRYITELQ